MRRQLNARQIRIGVAFSVAALTLAPAMCAELFMYEDANGVQHFTNIPTDQRFVSIPEGLPAIAAKPASTLAVKSNRQGRERYAQHIARAAADTGIPEELLHAMIKIESNYDANAVSRKGAMGLMQLMPATALQYGVADARDPAANILAGARYLKHLLSLFNADMALALAAYNAGPGAVMRNRWSVPAYPETQRYVPHVMELYRRASGS